MDTAPNGDPPFGSSKIPTTWSGSVAPVGVSTESREPTVRWWSSAYRFLMKAPRAPSCDGTLPLPADHFIATTCGRLASTPFTCTDLPFRRALPLRISDTTVTPGALAAAAAALFVR